MSLDKVPRQNRVREALGRIYEHHPPYFREYLRKFQEDPTSRVFAPLAEEYRRLGRFDEAIEICREGLRHHPDFHAGRVALAKCLIDKKQASEARIELERVVQLVPENLLAQRLLGDVCVTVGDIAAALHSYKMALLLAPSDVGLAERIRALEKGEVSLPVEITTETPGFSEQEHAATEARASDAGETMSEARNAGIELGEGDDLPPLWDVPSRPQPNAEEPAKGPVTDSDVEALFSKDDDIEAFTTEHVSAVFGAPKGKSNREITTETLGDLYFSQGQYDRALRIFEKIADESPSREIQQKVDACRMKMGVDSEELLRRRQIDALKGVLSRVKTASEG